MENREVQMIPALAPFPCAEIVRSYPSPQRELEYFMGYLTATQDSINIGGVTGVNITIRRDEVRNILVNEDYVSIFLNTGVHYMVYPFTRAKINAEAL